jgi:uncharacterized damage-inducible protein DinB
MSLIIPRPTASEHAPWAITYIEATSRALTAQGTADVVALLAGQPSQWRALLAAADPALVHHAYAPGKWTLGESLVHVSDTERVFAYRLLRIARGDQTPLPGFDQDTWVPESRVSRRTLHDILDELEAIRASTLALVRSLDEVALTRSGTASSHLVSARALVWMLAGHMAHHLVLTADKYLAGEPLRR